MQEEIEMKSITLAINGGKFSGRVLKNVITKLLAEMKNGHQQHQARGEVVHHGKQSVKELIGQNQGVKTIEINDAGIRDFKRIAKKYGVDYAVKKVNGDKPKYLVFFKARDADALTAAFTEYADSQLQKEKRPSVLNMLRKLKALARQQERPPEKNRNKEQSL